MDALQKALNGAAEETLDPDDWTDVQALSHRILDDAVDYLRGVRDRPVWEDVPAEIKAFFAAPLPRLPAPLASLPGCCGECDALSDGNVHPRFWAV
jgi:hypothetical protein